MKESSYKRTQGNSNWFGLPCGELTRVMLGSDELKGKLKFPWMRRTQSHDCLYIFIRYYRSCACRIQFAFDDRLTRSCTYELLKWANNCITTVRERYWTMLPVIRQLRITAWGPRMKVTSLGEMISHQHLYRRHSTRTQSQWERLSNVHGWPRNTSTASVTPSGSKRPKVACELYPFCDPVCQFNPALIILTP